MNGKTEWYVKNVKVFDGMEGHGFKCSLYRGDKKVAEAIDDASGSPVDFRWLGAKENAEAFVAHCRSLPKWGAAFGDKGDIFDTTPEIAISDMVNEFMDDRRLRRHCHSKILFKVPGDGTLPGNWRTIKGTFTVAAVASMKRRFGENVEILNFKYGEPA